MGTGTHTVHKTYVQAKHSYTGNKVKQTYIHTYISGLVLYRFNPCTWDAEARLVYKENSVRSNVWDKCLTKVLFNISKQT